MGKAYTNLYDLDSDCKLVIFTCHFVIDITSGFKLIQGVIISDLIHAIQNPKLFWQTIKGNNVSQPTPENTDSLSNEEWFQYFATLFSEPEAEANFHNARILGNITQDNNIDNLEQPITEQEIRTSIQNLNINKSGGPDGLCIEMLKATLDTTLPYLHSLFNDIYDNGLFPEDWCKSCKSIISPIHKAGPVDKPKIIEQFV